jgi:hypothetical protein
LNQRLLFLALFAAYVASGIFEVFDNLLGLREFNFDSSAPPAAKVAKELAVMLLLGSLFLAHRRSIRIRSGDLVLAVLFASLLVLPSLLVHDATSARVGYAYLVASMAALWMASKVALHVDSHALDTWFLGPIIIVICATQLLEIAVAPTSFYNESSLIGLDRRAGLAVIPTTAGCFGALAVYRLRGFRRALALMVVVLANSSIGWAGLILVLIAGIRNKRLLPVLVPAALSLLVFLISLRVGFEESSSTRVELIVDSWQQLHLLLPSPIGALATTKSVALDPGSSFIADSTLLEFAHVFGIVPGILMFGACLFMVWRSAGGLGLLFFVIASSGFLLLEAWVLAILLIFALARPPSPALVRPGTKTRTARSTRFLQANELQP